VPFKESDPVNHPVSLYAATKKSNELLAHTYSHLYKIPSTGLRFFTVYGPWGRPDMAPMIFTKKIFAREAIKIFNNGDMFRDFTYIDDVVNGIVKCSFKPATSDINFDKLDPNPSTSYAPHRIFNIGNSDPIKLMDFINVLEQEIGIEAKKEFVPMQPGDVVGTFADTNLLKEWVGFSSSTSLKEGIKKFVAWYKDFYKI
jgi:UDP-glucuronate 4-epimerase